MSGGELTFIAENIKEIKDAIKVINSKLDKNTAEFNKLSVVVRGNGTKGHEQRIEALEIWKATRPKECPAHMERGTIIKQRALEVSIMGVIVSIISLLINNAGTIARFFERLK